jgi:outer membrane protein assembly factor BamA
MALVLVAAALVSSVTPRALAQPEAPPPEPPPAGATRAPDTWGAGRADDVPGNVPKSAPLSDGAGPVRPPTAERAIPAPPRRRARSERTSAERVRYTLEGIELRGNLRTRARVVLRYLPFEPGDLLDVDDPAVELARYRLLGTGFFRDVQFSLRKGSERGRVVLVVEVVERNTIVINDIWMGLGADADTGGNPAPLTAYAGLDVAETNLAGSGITLGGAVGLARDQLALRVNFLDRAFLGSSWMTNGSLLFNRGKDFFGNADVRWDNPFEDAELPDSAVVRYTRFGGSLGVGRNLSISTQLWAHYRLEVVDAQLPRAASHVRGGEREPIQFDMLAGRSVLSTVRGVVQHDTRDSPFLPNRGWSVTVAGELSLAPAGSDWDYQRLELDVARWLPLPWSKHVLKLQLFAGAISGETPFFEQFYVNDFSDFRPGRVLGLNFDRRPPPDLLNTSIVEVRRGHYAGKLGFEYRIPLYRGRRSVYGIDLFASAGLYALAGHRDLKDPARGYSGAARIPLDLTANLGFRMDTSAGGFVFAFANSLGFIPVLSEGE